MKCLPLYFLVLILVAANHNSYAQNSIIAGKITDENDKAVTGAVITVEKQGMYIEAKSDQDGLFYTRLLPADNYSLCVTVNGKLYKAKPIYLPPAAKQRVYYYLEIAGGQVHVMMGEQDPFLKAKLSKIEKRDDNMIDMPSFRMKRNEIDFDPNRRSYIFISHKDSLQK